MEPNNELVASLLADLSARERDIFVRCARGEPTKIIARALDVSPSAVGTYIGRIRRKTGLTSVVEMAHFAISHRIIEARFAEGRPRPVRYRVDKSIPEGAQA